MKITHIITDLDTGGAEMMLYKLLASLRGQNIESSVIILMGFGAVAKRIETLGIKVETLGLEQGARPSWRTIIKLRRFIQDSNPDVVQGWMYHGNIAATMAVFLHQPLYRRVKLFWNVRQTLYDINSEKIQTRWLIILGRWLSFFTHGIIYNSSLSAEQHCNIGFSKKKTRLIYNGFNLQKFHPNKNYYQKFRKELKISDNAILIGHISRLHPMKDHATLLRTIERVTKSFSSVNNHSVVFLLIGRGVTSMLSDNPSIHFLGERSDIPEIMSALDIVISSSAWGEGFPNVIGEAMASEVPCVVTNVGDSAHIVGKYGEICPVGDDQCLADSLMKLIENKKERKTAGKQARKRIKENYSIDKINKEYLKEWGS